jgi:flagellar hook-basal body complex protein FliE
MRIAAFGDAAATAAAIPPISESGTEGTAGTAFGDRLEAAMADLEKTTTEADVAGEGLVTGEVDLHEAMVAMEKADLVLRVAGTVRNKVIEAYQQLVQAAGG